MSTALTRRKVVYADFDALIADVSALRSAASYRRCGQWSLAGNCEHMGKAIEMSLQGTDLKVPLLLRLAGPVMLKITLWRGKIPAGIQGPPELMPAQGMATSDVEAADAFLKTIHRYIAFTSELHPSPLFGKLSRAKWDQLHLLHAAHHFSFIVPDA